MSNTSGEVNLNPLRRDSKQQAKPSLYTRTQPEAVNFWFIIFYFFFLSYCLPFSIAYNSSRQEGYCNNCVTQQCPIYFVHGTRTTGIWVKFIAFQCGRWLRTGGCKVALPKYHLHCMASVSTSIKWHYRCFTTSRHSLMQVFRAF